MIKKMLLSALITASLLMTACSSLPTHKPVAPNVSIAAVRPLNLSLVNQKLAFTLDVENPNSYDLPVEGLDFIASFAGNEIASGSSDQEVTLPAKGTAQMEVIVETSLNDMMDRFSAMMKSDGIDLSYGITGTVKLANWPGKIPFNVDGELEAPAYEVSPAEEGERI
ncbi:LEA type 2 family protein [Granulosicoccaceae sp. 1_MG-2023]|nr:LEA type 2 family protein [Granulosicoccaceae sp. 1_MG-2023]